MYSVAFPVCMETLDWAKKFRMLLAVDSFALIRLSELWTRFPHFHASVTTWLLSTFFMCREKLEREFQMFSRSDKHPHIYWFSTFDCFQLWVSSTNIIRFAGFTHIFCVFAFKCLKMILFCSKFLIWRKLNSNFFSTFRK